MILEASVSEAKPNWNAETFDLSLHGEIIRRVGTPCRASNMLCILNAFQARGWPVRIRDPLPGLPDFVRLHKAIESLNRGLKRIVFRADGTGAGIRWELKALSS